MTVAPAPGCTWLVLPTYQEAENIEDLVAAVRRHMPEPRRILIVDDSSPDGTGSLADRLAAAHDDVEVLHRAEKEGLGPAYLAGFKRALAGGAARICEMDSDFSHSPTDLPRLIAAVNGPDGADIALGSRYVRGGACENWSWSRRALSRAGSLYARVVLGTAIRDQTGGFKCMRAEVLESIDLDSVRSRGYAFQIEITYRALQSGYTVRELPITFTDRERGVSKMTARITAEALWQVPLLRMRRRLPTLSGDARSHPREPHPLRPADRPHG